MITHIVIAAMLSGNTCEPLPEGQDVFETCYDHIQNVAQCERLGDEFLDAGLNWCESRAASAEATCCEPEAYAYFECRALLSCEEVSDPPQCIDERETYADCIAGGWS